MAAGQDAPIRMLIVNDRVEDAEAIVSNLRNFGLPVRPSRPADVHEMQSQLEQHTFDIVLAAPSKVIREQDVIEGARGNGRDLPVVLLLDEVNNDVFKRLSTNGIRNVALAGQFDLLRDVVIREFNDLNARRGLRRLESQVRETERRCDSLIESSRDPIAYVHEGMHIRANSAYLDMFAYDDFEDIEGMSLLDMVAPPGVAAFKQVLKDMSKGEAPPPRFETQARDSHGNDFPAVMEFTQAKYEGESCIQVVIRRQEVDPALAEEVETLRRRDLATGLLNRQTFLQLLEQAVAEASAGKALPALLLIEPDHIAQLHQQVGLDNVDDLAAAVADRLASIAGEDRPTARMGENIFAILLRNTDFRETVAFGEQIRAAFDGKLLETADKTLSATVSVGGVLIGERIAVLPRVLAKGTESLQAATTVGGNRVDVFDPSATEREEEERIQAKVRMLREALANDGLTHLFQAVVNLQDESEQFHESMLRLVGNDGQLMMPAQFIPLAVEHGMAGEVDRWSINQLLAGIKVRNDIGQRVRVLAKISQPSLDDEALVADIRQLMDAHGVQPDQLVIELSESKVFTNLRAAQRLNDELQAMGSAFCIEHFGSGINSVQLLSHLKPKFLKLNDDFIKDLASNADHQARVAEIVAAAKQAGIATIARGVSDAATMTSLFTSGIDYMQGDFVAPIVPQLGGGY